MSISSNRWRAPSLDKRPDEPARSARATHRSAGAMSAAGTAIEAAAEPMQDEPWSLVLSYSITSSVRARSESSTVSRLVAAVRQEPFA
jgi:hypothetical protein